MATGSENKRLVISQLVLFAWTILLTGFTLTEIEYTRNHGWVRCYRPLLVLSHHFGPAIPSCKLLPTVGLIVTKLNNSLRLAIYAGLLFSPIFSLTQKLIYLFLGVTVLNIIA